MKLWYDINIKLFLNNCFHLIIYVFLTVFVWNSQVKINMGKGIFLIYKYDQRNLTYWSPNTTFVIPPYFDMYIQKQCNSAYDAYVGANDLASYRLDQSTKHHGNMEGKIMMIHSYMRHLGNIIDVIPLLVIQLSPQQHRNHPQWTYL